MTAKEAVRVLREKLPNVGAWGIVVRKNDVELLKSSEARTQGGEFITGNEDILDAPPSLAQRARAIQGAIAPGSKDVTKLILDITERVDEHERLLNEPKFRGSPIVFTGVARSEALQKRLDALLEAAQGVGDFFAVSRDKTNPVERLRAAVVEEERHR